MNTHTSLKGIYTALVTPFDSKGEIDYAQLEILLEKQKKSLISGVIPCGTTGESPTLSSEEKKDLIKFCIQYFKNTPIKVIAGTGSNNTKQSVEFSSWASQAGANAVLVVTPYYNKPTQNGLVQHFQKIADNIDCDLILYNVPGRTITAISEETILKLAEHKRITAIKEASGNMALAKRLASLVSTQKKDLVLLSGDDVTYFPFLEAGGEGIISVASNIVPGVVKKIFDFYKSDLNLSKKLFENHLPFFKALFCESNPIPIKFALSQKLRISNHLRLPLTPLSESAQLELLPLLKTIELD